MRQFFVLFVISLGALARPAIAQAVSLSPDAQNLPAKWSRCSTKADCVIISHSCGPSWGINAQYKIDAEARLCKDQQCENDCGGTAHIAYAVNCEENRCVPDYIANQPEPHHYPKSE